ncbi:DNA-directed RNA polymerase subunit beta' [Striga asiatica]|uniref:DNA-directed RNA polymerase subunit beta n=1 Tax=Striga asiatica TaxID=4170 RepID=A0A5A7P902_STRAF|nr:DNA-directed RNA polymerase subunit beta' [Striga asiatica]
MGLRLLLSCIKFVPSSSGGVLRSQSTNGGRIREGGGMVVIDRNTISLTNKEIGNPNSPARSVASLSLSPPMECNKEKIIMVDHNITVPTAIPEIQYTSNESVKKLTPLNKDLKTKGGQDSAFQYEQGFEGVVVHCDCRVVAGSAL